MSILIKGMGMPRDCGECRFGYDGKCFAVSPIHRFFVGDTFECPLVEVPTPHGRLIDADALRVGMYHEAFETDSELQRWDSGCWVRYKMFENHMDNAPTIIEAEE